ncbi:MAG: ParB/RepB/Spo0J family partition protein [Archangium sp.]|nr:ParB/RepB/Spo0J family partition protein [Archangium sp.]
MSAAVALAQFQMIDLTKLGESSFNPRKHFDEKKQAALNASVAAKGVLEPILVRPIDKGFVSSKQGGPERFEVVAGARRFRAAQAAELKTVPCLVRELTDVEALEVAVIENVEREDISALDEGDAYRGLMKLGRTVEDIVEKTGRSRTIVFARMKLAELQGEARELVLTGKWSPSIGELIARLPTPKAQEAAMKSLQDRAYMDLEEITFREAKELLDEEFVLHLSKAPFDIKAEQLVAAAGPCAACPKRTHAPDNREQFKDVKADTCLDGECWNKKKAASFKELQAELAADGKKLVKEKKLIETTYYSPNKGGFTEAAKQKYSKPTEEIIKGKTWKDLLGDEVPKVVVLDGENKTHNLVDKKKALELLEAKDPKAAAKAKERPVEEKPSWEKEREADNKKFAAKAAVAGVVRVKTLDVVTKLETAADLLIASLSAQPWHWAEAVRQAGLPEGTKADKLKPADRVRLIVGQAFTHQNEQVVAQGAKLSKVDVKALTKKALAAEPGSCFVCGCTAEKPCKAGGKNCTDEWTDGKKSTVCFECQRGEED